LGRSHIVALLATCLAGIYYIGTGISWANNAHDFYVNYLSSITPNQIQQQVMSWAYWFFIQQQVVIIQGALSIPVLAFVAVIAAISAYAKSKH
jgi:hypothetical protein